MVHTVSRLTVYFEDPFWVGVYERECGGRLEAAKVTFGAQPKDYEIYAYFLRHWKELRFSPSLDAPAAEQSRVNPKRMQRSIQKTLTSTGIGTKAQQALKAQQEGRKAEGRVLRRQRTLEEKQRQFALRQQKKKEKHRGR